MARRSKAELKAECRHRLIILEILCDAQFPESGSMPNPFKGAIGRIAGDIDTEAKPLGSTLYGINEAIGDLVEALVDLEGVELQRLDKRLLKQGCPSLSQLRSRQWKRVEWILGRQRIDSESDYQLAVEKLSDVSTSGLAEDQRHLLEQLVSAYQQRPTGALD